MVGGSGKSANFAVVYAPGYMPCCVEMNVTIRHISHLLRDSDVLAVPGLGVFSRRYISARFDGGVLESPSEEIVFVAQPVLDDDVLVRSIACGSACSLTEAAACMANDVADINAHLAAGRRVVLADVGSLVPTSSGNAVFEVSAEFAARSYVSWLAPVSSLDAPSDYMQSEESAIEQESRRKVFMQSLQRTASSAAAVALLALIAFVASQLPRNGESEPQLASFGFEKVDIQPTAGITEPEHNDKALVLILNTPADGMCIVEPEEKKPEAVTVAEANYFLVVASLASASEADLFIAGNADVPGLALLETEGRYRVYAASGVSFASTKAAADSAGLFDRFPSAWICRR